MFDEINKKIIASDFDKELTCENHTETIDLATNSITTNLNL